MPKSNHFPTDPRFPAFRAQVEADYGGSLPDDAFYAGEEMPHEPYHHETALAFRMFAAGWKAALQQAGERDWVLVPREPTSDMLAAADSAIPRFEEESDGSRLMGVDGALDAWKAMIAVSPLPQQTALVEEGVEKIIAQHEPAACGASAPSEPPQADGDEG